MSQFHGVFCRAVDALTRQELASFAYDSWYEDEPLRFTPAEDDLAADEVNWREFVIELPISKRPIAIRREIDQEAISALVEEALEKIEEESQSAVVEHLRNTRQVLSIEIFPDYLTDDAWELLDLVQAFLARRLNGLLVTDDGVYDQDLKLLVER